jgi:hypothetical protein
MELRLGDTLAHGTGTADATGDHLEQVVDVVCATPLLVGDHVDLVLHLGFLDQLAVRAHAALREGPRELVRDQCRRVQARKRDELPAVAEVGESLDVRFLVLRCHGGFPVEGWRKVVCQSVQGG